MSRLSSATWSLLEAKHVPANMDTSTRAEHKRSMMERQVSTQVCLVVQQQDDTRFREP